MIDLMASPNIVEWSEIVEVPLVLASNGSDTLRIQVGVAVGINQFKQLVHFVDNKDVA